MKDNLVIDTPWYVTLLSFHSFVLLGHNILGTSNKNLSTFKNVAPVHNKLAAMMGTTPQAVALAPSNEMRVLHVYRPLLSSSARREYEWVRMPTMHIISRRGGAGNGAKRGLCRLWSVCPPTPLWLLFPTPLKVTTT
ncbi:hypothetical protein K474DRAFT_1086621 [Panus rudis PR-1116 ss-1]|nr:hypothetical protein K474DRAFT_1086621 [Panus rudis PR-1116 ss-1]